MQELVVESLMVSLAMVMLDVLVDDEAQMTLAEWDDSIETLLLDRPDEPLGIGIEIGTLRRKSDRLNAAARQDLAKNTSVMGISVVNQMPRSPQEAIDRVGQIAGLLLHPRAARLRMDPGDGHAAGLQLDHEEDKIPRWWYHERTSVGFLAAAAWSVGGVALEEYSTIKTRDGKKYRGRCDLYVRLGSPPKELLVEAKHLKPNVNSKDDGHDDIERGLRQAVRDVRTHDPGDYHRLGVRHAPSTKTSPGHPTGTSRRLVETVLMLTRDEKLFAVASLAVLVTHVLGDTGEPTLGAGNLGLGVPPRLLGARLDVVVQHSLRLGQDLFGRASGLRVTGKFPTGALGEQAQQFHRIQYRSFS